MKAAGELFDKSRFKKRPRYTLVLHDVRRVGGDVREGGRHLRVREGGHRLGVVQETSEAACHTAGHTARHASGHSPAHSGEPAIGSLALGLAGGCLSGLLGLADSLLLFLKGTLLLLAGFLPFVVLQFLGLEKDGLCEWNSLYGSPVIRATVNLGPACN